MTLASWPDEYCFFLYRENSEILVRFKKHRYWACAFEQHPLMRFRVFIDFHNLFHVFLIFRTLLEYFYRKSKYLKNVIFWILKKDKKINIQKEINSNLVGGFA